LVRATCLIVDGLVTAVEVGALALTQKSASIAASRAFARAFVRGATLADASGPINAEGGWQNDARGRVPLKHQSWPLAG
jgi:hypothetical protein